MKRIALSLLTFLAFCCQITAQDNDNTTRLWDNKPANIWLEAYPIGNGRLGGMVYGGIATDEIQLNEDSFWSGGPHNNNSTTSLSYLDQVRELIFKGKEKDAEDLINQQFIKGPHGQKYLTLGSLKLIFQDINTADAQNYMRELDLEKALSTVTFDCGGHTFRRTTFASMPDSVIVIHLETDSLNSFSIKHSAPLSTTYAKGDPGITATVNKDGVIVAVEGCDKELVGQAAARIRSYYPAEPHKGKGVKYVGEVIRRKQGKKMA